MDDLEEMDKFLEPYTLPRLNDEETGADSFTGPFYQTFKEDLTLSLSNSSQKLKRKKRFLTHFMRPTSL